MNYLGSTALIVLVLVISPTSALPKPATLSYLTKEVMPVATTTISRTTVIPERPGQSRRDRARALNLTYAQKQALILAYRAGNHYGIGLLYAAIIWQESKLCKFTLGDHGRAHGCAQLHESAVKAVTGVMLSSWELTDPDTQELNLAIGARYLDLCLQRFGYPAGIAAYNMGIPRAAKMGRVRLSRLPYTKAVLANMKQLQLLPQSED